MNDLVSIITPTFNSEDFIEETIKSVQNQTYENWEMLITDDCSSDNTVEIVKKIAEKDPRVKLFRLNQNSGSAVARNNSIERASGRYHAFLDADDIWLPSKLSVQISVMKEKSYAVSHSSYSLIDEAGNSLGFKILAIEKLSFQKLLKNNYIGNLTGIYDCEKIGKIFCPLLRKRQDWGLWITALKKSGKPSVGITEVLAMYRLRKDSISSNKFKLLKYNFLIYNKFLKYGYFKSLASMLVFLNEYFFVKPTYKKKL